jgi:V8-like Glu-specific endopeptidase
MTVAYPFNANIAISMQDGTCSAVSIGQHTAISAAHCFFQNGKWHNFDPAHGSFLAPSANAWRAPPNDFPWGKFSCYVVWLYNGWFSAGNSHYYDMAVMDFSSCGNSNNPAWVAGSAGYYVNYPYYNILPFEVYGYPASCPGLTLWPQLCGMVANGTVDPNGTEPHYLKTTSIDTSPGDSGTSWMWRDASNGWEMTFGTHIGDWAAYPWQPTTNYARRLDSTYWSLVQQASIDY